VSESRRRIAGSAHEVAIVRFAPVGEHVASPATRCIRIGAAHRVAVQAAGRHRLAPRYGPRTVFSSFVEWMFSYLESSIGPAAISAQRRTRLGSASIESRTGDDTSLVPAVRR
jgi:hypothetical protein